MKERKKEEKERRELIRLISESGPRNDERLE